MGIRIQTTRPFGVLGYLYATGEFGSFSIDERTLNGLRGTFDALSADGQVSRIVVCGDSGQFISGVDVDFFIQCLTANEIDRVIGFTQASQSLLISISRSPKPVVAFVDGPAFGGGLEIALACHRIVAGPKAKFCFPELGLGIYPGMGGTQRLPRRIGIGLAKWMIYTGSIVPAEHALQIGLIDALAPADSTAADALKALDSPSPRGALDDRFRNLAELFSQRSVDDLLNPSLPAPTDPQSVRALVQVRSAAPQALRLAERVIDRGIALPLLAGLDEELAHLPEVLKTNDALIGLQSLGKPRPKFSGT